MIPEKDLIILIAFSRRNKDNDLVLVDDAPKDVVELAKQYGWAPFNKEFKV